MSDPTASDPSRNPARLTLALSAFAVLGAGGFMWLDGNIRKGFFILLAGLVAKTLIAYRAPR